MAKTPRIFTVRNASGQFLGTYYALTAAQALQKFNDDQRAYAVTLRSHGMIRLDDLTAEEAAP